MAKFDAKSFNEKAFGKYMSAIPNVKLNKLRESRAIVGDARLRDTFVNNSQTGTVYAVLPFFGLLSGTPQNYDGVDNVTPGKTDTYEQGVFTYGRMNGWTEADFSYDVTGGTDFMANVRNQINDYWNGVDQDVILAILEGVFGMKDTGTGDIKKANAAFVEAHTYDIAQYPASSGKKGGTLRRGWTGEKRASAQGYADSLTVNHFGDTYVIEIVNPVEYASYVEYGHRTANHSGWVKGQFMMTISEQELQRIAPKVLENKIKKYLGGLGK